MLGGYRLERLGVAEALSPVRDPELMIELLIVIRDTLAAAN